MVLKHCANNHVVLKTSKNMIDVVILMLCYMKDVPIVCITPTSMHKFAELLSFHNECFADKKNILKAYVNPIAKCLIELKDARFSFTDKEFWRLDWMNEAIVLETRWSRNVY